MIYGYARVSTKGQARNGNSLKEQREKLIELGVADANVYEDAYSAKSNNRPNLNKLIEALQEGDTLIVTKFDRMARSLLHGLSVIEELTERGVTVNILDMASMDNKTATGKLIRNVLLSVAEFEREIISERTKAGKEIARQKPNYKEGRPRIEIEDSVIEEYVERIKEKKMTATHAAKSLGISRTKWYQLVKEYVQGQHEPILEVDGGSEL